MGPGVAAGSKAVPPRNTWICPALHVLVAAALTVAVTDVAPGFSSGAAGSVAEGAIAGTTVYTAAASDVAGGTVVYSLTGADAAAFTIDSTTGVVGINAIPDYETKSS